MAVSGVRDGFVTIGQESAWKTRASTLTRGIEDQDDNVTPVIEQRSSRGRRKGQVGKSLARSTTIDQGGDIALKFDLMAKSHGLVLGGVGASYVITTPVGATNARLHTITPTTAGATKSYTIHDERPFVDGTAAAPIDYLGAVMTSLKATGNPKSNALIEAAYNYGKLGLNADPVSPVYPAESTPVYNESHLSLTIDGDDVDCAAMSSSWEIPTAVKTDRDRVCGRGKPITTSEIVPTVDIGLDYATDAYFEAWVSGAAMPVVWEWNAGADSIEAGFDYFFRVTFSAVQLRGDSPKDVMDDTPTQGFKGEAMDNHSDPVWKIEYQTTDTVA